MRDIAATIGDWLDNRQRFALGRVMTTWGSAPRRVGSAMAVSDDQRVVGSVSGGCVEGEVIRAAQQVIETGEPRILDFGVSDETAWSVGLSCGGTMSVLLERFPTLLENKEAVRVGRELVSALLQSRPAVWLTLLPPDRPDHLLVYPDGRFVGNPSAFGASPVDDALEAYRRRFVGTEAFGDRRCFVQSIPPPAKLLVVGATDIAVHLVRLARDLDFETIVVDPRTVFASADRFSPPPDRLIAKWPEDALDEVSIDDETYAVLLTHNPRIDDPALHVLLAREVAYIGALGGTRTQRKRVERLLQAGFSISQVDRIHGPVGLDIGARSPAEIALSVLAEAVQCRNRRASQVTSPGT